MGFADDFKMIADVTVNSKAEVQLEIDNIAKWAKDYDFLFLSKSHPLCIVARSSHTIP